MVSHIERVQNLQEEMPDEYRDVIYKFTGEGRRVESVRACLAYIQTDDTAEQVAERFDVTPVTILNLTPEIGGYLGLEPNDWRSSKSPWR